MYGSRDRRDRVNRRISKEDHQDQVVLSGRYDVEKTACSHANIHYIPKYQDLTKEQVDAAIMPLLPAAKRAHSPTPTGSSASNALTLDRI